jgi:hypothetical protein
LHRDARMGKAYGVGFAGPSLELGIMYGVEVLYT